MKAQLQNEKHKVNYEERLYNIMKKSNIQKQNINQSAGIIVNASIKQIKENQCKEKPH